MSTNAPVDWAELAPQLLDAARQHQAWYLTIARELVAPGDQLRLHAAQDRWFTRMRAELPDSRWIPHGWTEALHRDDLFRLSARSVHLGVRR